MSKENYELSKNDRLNEALLYAANTVIELGKKSYAFTTSNKYKKQKDYIVSRVVGRLYDRQQRVLFLDAPISNIANDQIELQKLEAFDYAQINNADPEVVQRFLDTQQENYDFVILNLPPVALSAMAVEYAKLCECTLLIERYGYSEYTAYEDSLLALRQHGVHLGGVITYE